MKIHRLVLRNFRGVAERELELAPQGVTLVSGPNEVGKSSLAEAVELLFDERDSTTRQRVREVQPVDRDAGAEVEADVELGPLRFRYAKRFHRRPETRVEVQAPRARTLTGREAHEQVRAWLEEHVDVALWRALRLLQGEPLAQPALHESASLAQALDRAAGVSGGGEREESLFEAARAARAEHTTPTGRPRAELQRLEREAEQSRAEETRIEGELEAVERAADEEGRRLRRAAALETARAADRAALREADAEREAVRSLRESCARLDAQVDTVRARLDAAVQRARQRGQLVSSHAGGEAEVESLAEALESEEPAQIAAAAELRHLEVRLEEARQARAAWVERTAGARRDAALLRAESERAELDARCERVERERAERARLREVLARPALAPQQVRDIARAQTAAERAQARLATEGPSVQLDAERDLEVVVDGHRVALRAGEALEQRVSESLVLAVPGLGELRVVAGAGVAEQRKALEQAETALRSLCMEAGVDDHADAVRTLGVQRSAREELARAERRLEEALGGVGEAELEARRQRLAERAARARAARPGDTPLPDSAEEAEARLESVEVEDTRAREELEERARRRDSAAERFRRHQEHRGNTRNRLELAQQSRADLARRLAAARDEVADEVLESTREQLATELEALEARAREACERLAAREPEALEARAAALRQGLERGERELRAEREALERLRGQLDEAGQRGLFDDLQRARRTRHRAERDWLERRRRAEAADRLFEALRRERDAARSHYAEPLAREIARLGRGLFGPDFDVELDEELRVALRIQAGRELSVAQLSAGTREQIALLARVAAARLAGGVPLWIDDALGHTDAGRLEALGPLLAAAGETSQVVVLTCAPERFRSLSAARVVELR